MAKEKLGRFQVFTDTNRNTRVVAGIAKNGRIAISEGAYRTLGLEKAQYVLQLFDPDSRQIGLQLFEEKSREGLVKLQRRKSSGGFIMAETFLKSYGILPDSATFYQLRRSPELPNVLIIDLDKVVERSGKAMI